MEQNRKKHVVFSTLKDMFRKGRTVEIPVYGLSMFPFFLPGDIVTAKNVGIETLKVGDVVFFERNAQVVFHRLVKIDIKNDFILTKGDGLMGFDKPFGKKEFLAKAVRHMRNQREIKLRHHFFFKTFIVFFTPVTGFFNWYLARLWSKFKY